MNNGIESDFPVRVLFFNLIFIKLTNGSYSNKVFRKHWDVYTYEHLNSIIYPIAETFYSHNALPLIKKIKCVYFTRIDGSEEYVVH